MENVVCVILAAGAGKRMQQGGKAGQKVLARIRRKPMLGHVLNVVSSVGIKRVIVVIGYQAEDVAKYLKGWRPRLLIETVRQKKLLGTADAVRQTEQLLERYDGDVLVLYGDTPLLTEATLKRLLAEHRTQQNACTLLTTFLKDPTGYGRIVRNGRSESIEKVVEEVDATLKEKAMKEINVGVYCFRTGPLFEALREVKPNNRKNEYYLTDTISILSRQQKTVRSVLSGDRYEVLGVNSPTELARARKAQDVFHKKTKHSATAAE